MFRRTIIKQYNRQNVRKYYFKTCPHNQFCCIQCKYTGYFATNNISPYKCAIIRTPGFRTADGNGGFFAAPSGEKPYRKRAPGNVMPLSGRPFYLFPLRQ
jgi:hypothetical protein